MTIGESNQRDYYRVLGVLHSANLAEITAAYHDLARRCHPDAGASDAESLARFKQVSEAYEVLSDEEKRRTYDRQRRLELNANASLGPVEPPNASFRPFKSTPTEPLRRGHDVEVELPITPEEAFHGGPCDFTLKVARACSRCQGRARLDGGGCGACQGEGEINEAHHLQLTLPRRAQTGMLIRIAGRGRRVEAEKSIGDLLVRLRIQPYW